VQNLKGRRRGVDDLLVKFEMEKLTCTPERFRYR
jgi:hypothetical protein